MCGLAKFGGQWLKRKGTVPLQVLPICRHDNDIVILGLPPRRRRAQCLPNMKGRFELTAWLRHFHLGQGHTSGAEMPQALKEAGSDP